MQRLSYYPDNGPWAVAARLGFLISLVAVSFAALAPAGGSRAFCSPGIWSISQLFMWPR